MTDRRRSRSNTQQRRREASKKQAKRGYSAKKANLSNLALPALAVASALLAGSFQAMKPSDDISERERQKITATFSQAVKVPGGFGEPVAIKEMSSRLEVVNTLRELTPDASELVEDADAGRVDLVWLKLYDTYAEDGDSVAVENRYIRLVIPLLNAPVRVPIPTSPDETTVTVTGVNDGGGGVTVAIEKEGRGRIPLPPIYSGSSVEIPLR